MTRNRSDAAPDRPGTRGNGKAAQKRVAGGDELTAAQVAGYLRRHSDFLAEHPEVLDGQRAPGRMRDQGIIDLQQVMVERLRDEVEVTRESRNNLLATSRSNSAAQNRIHEAIIALFAAPSFEHLIETVTTDLAVLLDVDVVTLGVEQDAQKLPPVRMGGIYQLDPGAIDSILGPGRSILLRPEIEGLPMLFGAGAGLVASDALIRLTVSRATPPAMLAMGSRQAGHFNAKQGTELLGFLGRVLELSIRRWLDLPD